MPYGVVKLRGNQIIDFEEKKNKVLINAGFYIFDESILKFIKNKSDRLEVEVFNRILKLKSKKIVQNILTKWQPVDNWSNLLEASSKIKKDKNFFKK